MKTDFQKYDLPKAVSKKLNRYSGMLSIQVDVERRHAVATNGRILAIVPIEPDADDTSGLVSVDSWNAARKVKGIGYHDPEVSMLANGKCVVVDALAHTEQSSSRPEGDYPPFDLAIPKAKDDDLCVTLNADLLLALGKAIGAYSDSQRGICVSLRIPQGKGIPVTVLHAGESDRADDRPFGVIMPIVAER